MPLEASTLQVQIRSAAVLGSRCQTAIANLKQWWWHFVETTLTMRGDNQCAQRRISSFL